MLNNSKHSNARLCSFEIRDSDKRLSPTSPPLASNPRSSFGSICNKADIRKNFFSIDSSSPKAGDNGINDVSVGNKPRQIDNDRNTSVDRNGVKPFNDMNSISNKTKINSFNGTNGNSQPSYPKSFNVSKDHTVVSNANGGDAYVNAGPNHVGKYSKDGVVNTSYRKPIVEHGFKSSVEISSSISQQMKTQRNGFNSVANCKTKTNSEPYELVSEFQEKQHSFYYIFVMYYIIKIT